MLAFLLLSALVSAAEPTIPPASLREDFQIMRHALEEAHGGIYRYTSKAEMNRAFDRAFRKIDHPMSELEFWHLAAPVVADIRCGHTYLWFPKSVQQQFETTLPVFPLEVEMLGGRPFIYEDYGLSATSLKGCEILSINGVSTKKVLQELRSVITGDGDSRTAVDWRIGHKGGFGIYLYGFGFQAPFHLVCRAPDRACRTVDIAGMSLPNYERLRRVRFPQPDTPADLRFIDSEIAVLTIRRWPNDFDPERKVTFLQFLEQSFTQIHDKGIASLIIDVRNNPGGADAPGKDLFSFLWNRPFEYDRDIVSNAREFDFFKYDPDAKPIPADEVQLREDNKYHWFKHPNIGPQQPKQPHFAGRVFVLMNGGSFSTSTEFLSTLHFHKRATFIGQETGGAYYSLTAGHFVDVILPHSKLQLVFGLSAYYQAVSGYKYPNRGVMPDYPVTCTINDLLAGKDKEMDLAFALARQTSK